MEVAVTLENARHRLLVIDAKRGPCRSQNHLLLGFRHIPLEWGVREVYGGEKRSVVYEFERKVVFEQTVAELIEHIGRHVFSIAQLALNLHKQAVDELLAVVDVDVFVLIEVIAPKQIHVGGVHVHHSEIAAHRGKNHRPFVGVVHVRHVNGTSEVVVVDAVGEVFVEFEGFFVFEGLIEAVPQADARAAGPPRLVDVPQGLESHGDAFFAVAISLSFKQQRFGSYFVDTGFYRI